MRFPKANGKVWFLPLLFSQFALSVLHDLHLLSTAVSIFCYSAFLLGPKSPLAAFDVSVKNPFCSKFDLLEKCLSVVFITFESQSFLLIGRAQTLDIELAIRNFVS